MILRLFNNLFQNVSAVLIFARAPPLHALLSLPSPSLLLLLVALALCDHCCWSVCTRLLKYLIQTARLFGCDFVCWSSVVVITRIVSNGLFHCCMCVWVPRIFSNVFDEFFLANIS